ncbi:DUF3995 domain-containing protein [Deinococcus navajonensis]|uniref:DUF3995 domain-containing protein n=1 Tax=Deinococcus navajonensis TaxID=309884 RepID=A0ABV8XKT5_9DEIO
MDLLFWLVALVLVGLALLHLAWGLGAVWPGRDPLDLAGKVVGTLDPGRMPSSVACFIVAAGLAGSAVSLTLLPVLGDRWPVLRALGFAVGAVFLMRGVLGYLLPRLSRTGLAFDRLNRLIYSPLCLVLGGLTLLALRG